MDKIAEIKKRIQEVVGANPNLPITATVVSVQEQTCTVRLHSGLELSDIRLKATVDEGKNYLLLKPKVESEVILLSQTGNLSGLMIIKINEVEQLEYKQDGLEFLMDSSDKKIKLKNENTSLFTLFNDLSVLLRGLKVYTATGPSGLPLPDTITKIDQFEQKFKQLLKED